MDQDLENKPPLSGYEETNSDVRDHFSDIEPMRSQLRDFPGQVRLPDANFALIFGLVTWVLLVALLAGYRVGALNLIFIPVTLYLGREAKMEYKTNENRFRWSSRRRAVIAQGMALTALILLLGYFIFNYLIFIPNFKHG